MSQLRGYTVDELETLTHEIDATDYQWDVRRVRMGTGVSAIVVLGSVVPGEGAACRS